MTQIRAVEGVSRVPREDWNALVADESPFLEWDWLASLEEAGCVGPETGWLPRPLVAEEDGRIVAACPLYVKGHSEGEFVFDWGWADAALRGGIAYYPKLLVGVPFTPVAGARVLVARGADRPTWVRRMGEALRELCEANEMSGVHVNFCREDEIDPLCEARYQLRVGIQYHWSNPGYRTFDDYLGELRSKRRNQVRREQRAMADQDVRIEVLHGDSIPDDLFQPMFACYRSTVDAHYYGRRYLTSGFFDLLRERFRSRLCFVVAHRGGRVVGGTTNVVKGDAFYGRYWGALEPVRHLHFNVCYYAAIEHCIERGIARFEPGAGGDYKQIRGFDARPTWSLHFLADPRLAEAVGRFLDAEREEADDAIRHLHRRSALKSTIASTPPDPGAPRTGTRPPRR